MADFLNQALNSPPPPQDVGFGPDPQGIEPGSTDSQGRTPISNRNTQIPLTPTEENLLALGLPIQERTARTGPTNRVRGVAFPSQEEFIAQSIDLAREDLRPFADIGLAQIPGVEASRQQLRDIQLPSLQNQDFSQTANLAGAFGAEGRQQLLRQAQAGQGLTEVAAQNLLGETLAQDTNIDPRLLDSPFFQALQERAAQTVEGSAAQGLSPSNIRSEIGNIANVEGQGFAQRELRDRVNSQSQRFGQLNQALGTGLGALRTGAAQTGQAFEAGLTGQQQLFSQLERAQASGNIGLQQDLTNQLATQAQGFEQTGGLLNVGQRAVAGQAGATQQGGQGIINAITGTAGSEAARVIAEQQARGQTTGKFVDVGIGAFAASDRRLKSNIKLIGKTPGGNNWYSFDIFNESREGVMSDEVNHIPGAVVTHSTGFDMVDYSRIT